LSANVNEDQPEIGVTNIPYLKISTTIKMVEYNSYRFSSIELNKYLQME